MKQAITLFALFISLFVQSQITYQASMPSAGFEKFSTSGLGDKFVGNPSCGGDTVKIYNSDFSLYRAVPMPSGYSVARLNLGGLSSCDPLNPGGVSIPSVSDKLFNNDAQLEFLVISDNRALGTYASALSVLNEQGQITYTFPDSVFFSDPYLFSVGNNFYIAYFPDVNGTFHDAKIYSLPGSLPCSQCNFSSGVAEPGNTGSVGLIAYPNPFNSTLSIEYNLLSKQDAKLILTTIDGREVKTIVLNDQSNKIILNTADLPKGVIIASLYGNNQHLISKKLVKIE